MLRVGAGQTDALQPSDQLTHRQMKLPKALLTLSMVAIAALFPIPASAAAAEEAVVPPSNSAAAQYTEAFPTPGGDKKTDQAAHHRSPLKVLGSHKTKKLEEQGPAGKAAAEVAASTAPTSIANAPSSNLPSTPNTAGGEESNGVSGGGTGNGGGSGAPARPTETPDQAGTAVLVASDQSGSSGVGSTIGAATGLSVAGSSGLLLPLIIIATVLWSLAYLWRQRQRVD